MLSKTSALGREYDGLDLDLLGWLTTTSSRSRNTRGSARACRYMPLVPANNAGTALVLFFRSCDSSQTLWTRHEHINAAVHRLVG